MISKELNSVLHLNSWCTGALKNKAKNLPSHCKLILKTLAKRPDLSFSLLGLDFG